ncbi:hypothetical protein [Verrucomicrobium sp. BvORR034]|uniref:hypothetical protein n=1 Tax=Verrucomicrobium sp. BvORR034 TaxID=1396418 RepID=UPI000679CF90|nr:hypothetical protein [Verrucomicrobium sp. BvORR034]
MLITSLAGIFCIAGIAAMLIHRHIKAAEDALAAIAAEPLKRGDAVYRGTDGKWHKCQPGKPSQIGTIIDRIEPKTLMSLEDLLSGTGIPAAFTTQK